MENRTTCALNIAPARNFLAQDPRSRATGTSYLGIANTFVQ
jgi:hypothetical protein